MAAQVDLPSWSNYRCVAANLPTQKQRLIKVYWGQSLTLSAEFLSLELTLQVSVSSLKFTDLLLMGMRTASLLLKHLLKVLESGLLELDLCFEVL